MRRKGRREKEGKDRGNIKGTDKVRKRGTVKRINKSRSRRRRQEKRRGGGGEEEEGG